MGWGQAGGHPTADNDHRFFVSTNPNLIMGADIIYYNSWSECFPAIKEHLVKFLTQIRQEYFTDADGVISANYGAFMADILKAHDTLYEDSIPCRALQDEGQLREHQKAVKTFKTIDSYLKAGGIIHFKLHGWGHHNSSGVNIESVKVSNEMGTRAEIWDARGLTWLPERIGFDKMQNIVTEVFPSDSRYNEIRDALRGELAKWLADGNATWMRPVRDLIKKCGGLNLTLKSYLPESTNVERAGIILQLFQLDDTPFYIDPRKVAELLNDAPE